MKLQDVVENIVQDVAITLTEEFDRNFERKAFFDKKWPAENYPNSRGSQMMRSGKLRKSVNHTVGNNSISWKSSLPYASIQNEGGEIEVTAQMKAFFWAMYYKANGGAKSGTGGKQRVERLSKEASKWKAMALLKVGTVMTVDQKQFIGWHPKVDAVIEEAVHFNMEDYNKYLLKQLKQ